MVENNNFIDKCYEHTKKFKVGNIVSRTGYGDEHIIISIDKDKICMTVKCIKNSLNKNPSQTKWKIGEEEYNVTRRYQLIREK